MATLAGSTIASTYTYLLKMDATSGVTSSLVKVQDGDATDTALSVSTTDIAVDATDKIYLDAGGDTYVVESGADVLDFYVGGANMLKLTESTLDTIAMTGNTTLTHTVTTSASTPIGLLVDSNTSGVAAQDATGMHIDFDRTVAGSGTAAHNDIGINLDVNSASLGTSSLVGMDIDVVGATSGTSTATGLNIAVGSADTNYALITSGGSVGVGIAAPDGTLHVHTATAGSVTAPSTADDLVIEGDTTPGVSILMPNNGIGRYSFSVVESTDRAYMRYSHDAEKMFFGVGGADRMTITAGNVGIGTTAADTTLHLSNANAPTLRLENQNTGLSHGDHIGKIEWEGNDASGSGNRVGLYGQIRCEAWNAGATGALSSSGSEGGRIVFAAGYDDADGGPLSDTAITAYEHMCIEGNGNVGIGTATPDRILVVEGNVSADYIASFRNEGNNANRYGLIIYAGADDGSGTTDYITCQDGDGTQVGYIRNTSGTFALTDASDRRLKENIRDTEVKGLDAVSSMKVRDFEWKKSGDTCIGGFIAQELESAFAPAVGGEDGALKEDGTIEPMGVSRDVLVPVLVKAIQELSAKVEVEADYRLKENEISISDGLERLNQLKPYKFNFKTDPDKDVDGFFAHEVSDIVPEAIIGAKDAMKEEKVSYAIEVVEAVEAQDAVYETVTKQRQKVVVSEVEEEVSSTEIVLEDGKYVQKTTTKTVTKEVETPQYEEVPLYDEDGEEVGTHTIPVMEDYEEEVLVSEAVEAVDGIDAVDAVSESVPDYQSIDQSKLVPLLVASVQELSAKVEALENA